MRQQPKFKANCAVGIVGRTALRRGRCRTASSRRVTLARDEAAAHPPPVTDALLARGRERYDIYCAPCHGLSGDADGIIVHHGFPAPPSYHSAALLKAPASTFFDAITNGYGVMYSYAARISPRDRWAIVAYIRALQLSRHAKLADVPDAAEHLR